MRFNYLIELKYLKKSAASEQAVENAREEARRQMRKYLHQEEFAGDRRVKGVIYVVAKEKILWFEKME